MSFDSGATLLEVTVAVAPHCTEFEDKEQKTQEPHEFADLRGP